MTSLALVHYLESMTAENGFRPVRRGGVLEYFYNRTYPVHLYGRFV